MLWLVLAAVFITTVCLVLAVIHIFFKPRQDIISRMKVEPDYGELYEEPGSDTVVRRSSFFRILRLVGSAWPRRPEYLSNLQKKLLQARFYMRAEELIGLCLLFFVVTFLLFYQHWGSLLLALPAGIIGYRIPGMALEAQRKKNLKDLEKQIAPALATISGGLRAGYSFAQALEVVSQETPPPLAEEFGRVLRDNRMGRPMEIALREMVERVESSELEMVFSTIEIQRQVGGNMAELIDKIEAALRERAELREEIRSLTSQQRFSAVIVFLLPLGLAMIIFAFNPDYLRPLFQEQLGRLMLAAALMLQIIGFIIIRRFMKVEI